MTKQLTYGLIGGLALAAFGGGYLVGHRRPVVSDRIVTSDREVVTRTSAYVGTSKTDEKSRTEYKIVTRWTKGGDVVQTKEIEVVKEKLVRVEVKSDDKENRSESKTTEHVTTYSKPNWSVAGSYGLDRSCSLELDRRVWGPVSVGVRGNRAAGEYGAAAVVRVEW
jgi:hypothetical protein